MLRLHSALAVVVAVAAAGPALAQTTTLQPLLIRSAISDDYTDTVTIGPNDCNASLTLRWKYTPAGGNVCSDMAVWSTDATSCADAAGSGDFQYTAVPRLQMLTTPYTANFVVKVSDLPGFDTGTLADGGTSVTCGAASITKTYLVCGSVDTTLGTCGFTTASKMHAAPLKITYDTLPPGAPVITNSTATNGVAAIAFTYDSDSVTIVPYVSEVSADGGVSDPIEKSTGPASVGNIKVSGLVNGNTYLIQLKAIDNAGNVSVPSDAVSVTPVPAWFLGAYRDASGT